MYVCLSTTMKAMSLLLQSLGTFSHANYTSPRQMFNKQFGYAIRSPTTGVTASSLMDVYWCPKTISFEVRPQARSIVPSSRFYIDILSLSFPPSLGPHITGRHPSPLHLCTEFPTPADICGVLLLRMDQTTLINTTRNP